MHIFIYFYHIFPLDFVYMNGLNALIYIVLIYRHSIQELRAKMK